VFVDEGHGVPSGMEVVPLKDSFERCCYGIHSWWQTR
jgi:hypothetical protein